MNMMEFLVYVQPAAMALTIIFSCVGGIIFLFSVVYGAIEWLEGCDGNERQVSRRVFIRHYIKWGILISTLCFLLVVVLAPFASIEKSREAVVRMENGTND